PDPPVRSSGDRFGPCRGRSCRIAASVPLVRKSLSGRLPGRHPLSARDQSRAPAAGSPRPRPLSGFVHLSFTYGSEVGNLGWRDAVTRLGGAMKLAGVLEVGVLTVILLGLMARASQKRPEIDVRERAA